MSTRFEQFMRDHRDEFDADEPAPQIWKKLEQQLNPAPPKGKAVTMKFLRWSAAAAILVLAGYGVFHLFNPQKGANNPDVAQGQQRVKGNQATGDELLKDINPTYAKEVYHFTQLIELKQHQLKQIEKDNPALYKQFLTDITRLDSSYKSLQQELPTNPNREQLLEAMIQNLRLQTELLNQQLQIIQQIKKSKSGNDESDTKSV